MRVENFFVIDYLKFVAFIVFLSLFYCSSICNIQINFFPTKCMRSYRAHLSIAISPQQNTFRTNLIGFILKKESYADQTNKQKKCLK